MNTVDAESTERMAGELIRLLQQGAPADEFASRLADAENLAIGYAARTNLIETIRMAMAVRNRLDLWQQREGGMLAVIESARDLSSRLDLQELLSAIVTRARTMLGSHISWLSAYDETLDAFHVLASDGALAQSTGHMVAGRNLGIVSVVVSTRLPFTTADYLTDARFQHDPQLDATFRDEGIAAVVGVPLLWDSEVIGLLFVADRYHRTHSAQNISILSTLATHAAVAIKNARAFEQAGAALQAAQAARAEVERYARRMQAAAEAHEQMTSLLARGASLSTICQSMAQMLDGSVLVLDEAAQVIGRALAEGVTAGVEGYAPNGEHSAALAQALRQSRKVGRSVVAYEAEGEDCRVNAVIGGEDLLGSVLLFRREPLDDIAVRTFERCASVIGVVLLSRERVEASKSRDQAALLRALLSPRQDDLALLVERAERFGVPLGQPVSVLVAETEDPEVAYAARRLRSTNLLTHAVFDDIDDALVLLVPTTRAEDLRRLLTDFLLHQVGGHWRGVLSRPLATPAELPGVHMMLRRALPVLRRIGVAQQIVGQNEMALYSTLFETHDQASLATFLRSTIGPVTAYDDKRGTQLADTLLAYFESNQNAKLAAQRLGIHVNTVRQRLATTEQLLGHWGSAARALELHVALRLWHLGSRAQLG